MCRSPRDFEGAARDWMVCWGFADAHLTNVGPDDGIDVAASGAVAQVKSWMTPIGIAEVQRLRGAAHDGRKAFFFSLMKYTKAARRFADSAGVKLFRFSGYDGEIEASNAGAIAFLREIEILAKRTAVSCVEIDNHTEEAEIENIVADALNEVTDLPRFAATATTGSFMENYRRKKLAEIVRTVASALFKAARLPGFAVLDVRESGNCYVQYVAPTHLETVGRKFVYQSDPLTAQQYVRLAAIGWPTLKEGCGENLVYMWPNPPELADLVAVAVRTLIEVHEVLLPEDLMITVGARLE